MLRSRRLFSHLILAAAVVLSGCSLYESSGRKIIETNENDIVGPFGLNHRHTLSYTCLASHQPPKFLSEPLEAVQNQYENENMTVLMDPNSNPVYLAIEKTSVTSFYLSCKVQFVSRRPTEPILMSDVSEAAQLGHDELIKFQFQLERAGVAL